MPSPTDKETLAHILFHPFLRCVYICFENNFLPWDALLGKGPLKEKQVGTLGEARLCNVMLNTASFKAWQVLPFSHHLSLFFNSPIFFSCICPLPFFFFFKNLLICLTVLGLGIVNMTLAEAFELVSCHM